LVQETTVESDEQTPQAARPDRMIDEVQLRSAWPYSETFQAEGEPEMMMFAKGAPVQRSFSLVQLFCGTSVPFLHGAEPHAQRVTSRVPYTCTPTLPVTVAKPPSTVGFALYP